MNYFNIHWCALVFVSRHYIVYFFNTTFSSGIVFLFRYTSALSAMGSQQSYRFIRATKDHLIWRTVAESLYFSLETPICLAHCCAVFCCAIWPFNSWTDHDYPGILTIIYCRKRNSCTCASITTLYLFWSNYMQQVLHHPLSQTHHILTEACALWTHHPP